jgi:hypothetical protein
MFPDILIGVGLPVQKVGIPLTELMAVHVDQEAVQSASAHACNFVFVLL